MIFSDIYFNVYHKDMLVAEIEVTNNRKDISIKKHTENPAIQPFCGNNLTYNRICEFIFYRCFEYGRADREEILKEMHLTEYNPWEIIKITHGRLYEDFTWIKFPGENIKWKDVE